jgi:hypothetical protein
MTKPRLPKTDSIRELADFWDHHDLTEVEGELEVVDEPVFERPVGITVQLENADAQALRRMANSLGLPDAELVRQWVLERIHSTE